jgi:hypothetical protein
MLRRQSVILSFASLIARVSASISCARRSNSSARTTSGARSKPKASLTSPPDPFAGSVCHSDCRVERSTLRPPAQPTVAARLGGLLCVRELRLHRFWPGHLGTNTSPRTGAPPAAAASWAGERKGRGGRTTIRSRAPAWLGSTPSCAARPALRRGAAPALRPHERRGLRQDPPPYRRPSGPPRPALRRWGRAAPGAKLLSLWRELAGRPPSLDASRILDAPAQLDLAPPDPDSLAGALRDPLKGPDDPVSAAAGAVALAFPAFPTSAPPRRRCSPSGSPTSSSPSACAGPAPCRRSPPQSSPQSEVGRGKAAR